MGSSRAEVSIEESQLWDELGLWCSLSQLQGKGVVLEWGQSFSAPISQQDNLDYLLVHPPVTAYRLPWEWAQI